MSGGERLGGPALPPAGMEWLLETPRPAEVRQSVGPAWLGRPAERFPQCQHGEHSTTYISTVSLQKIEPSGMKVVYCSVCGQSWMER